jgi:hypothetical protein
MPTNKQGYLKLYYDNNYDKYHQKIKCNVCDHFYTYVHKKRHTQTLKHQQCINKTIPFIEKYKPINTPLKL